MKSFINSYLGQKLKVLRESSNRKQKDLAQILSTTQQSYSKIENGKTNFSDALITKICDTFQITPIEFISSQNMLSKNITLVSSNKNHMEDLSTRILFASFKKQLIEKELRIVELELEVRKHKRYKIDPNDFKPIYVMI
jgi:transcriptional regulator with XRE-family HTH domain